MTFLWFLEGLRTPITNQLMQLVTYLGEGTIAVFIICICYWCINKRFAYLLGFNFFASTLLVQSLKIAFRVPRPWILDPDFEAVDSAISGATGYSFPSGHTQSAVCLYFPLALKAPKKWIKALCFFLPFLVAFSRMYLGCHTPADVSVGFLVAVISLGVIWHFQDQILDAPKYRKYMALALIVLSCAVATYALFLNGQNIIAGEYAKDCCKAGGAGLGFACGWYLENTKFHFSTKTKHVWVQVLKVVIGLILVAVIKGGISRILGASCIAKFLEYFILVVWILAIYPWLYTHVIETMED